MIDSAFDTETFRSDSDTELESEGNLNLGQIVKETGEVNKLEMTLIEEKIKFISMSSTIIRDNYGADPLTLNSFIDKVNLVTEIMSENLESCFISFIKSKLDGKAREEFPDEVISISQIKEALRNRIRPVSSKVAKVIALSIKDNVDDLADSFER